MQPAGHACSASCIHRFCYLINFFTQKKACYGFATTRNIRYKIGHLNKHKLNFDTAKLPVLLKKKIKLSKVQSQIIKILFDRHRV